MRGGGLNDYGDARYNLAVGERLNLGAMLDRAGIDRATFAISVLQYNWGIGDSDYADRCYVFGSSEFTLSRDTTFWVDAAGVRHISNAAVIPKPDNFDFSSDTGAAALTNFIAKTRIVPSKIGRKNFMTISTTEHKSLHA